MINTNKIFCLLFAFAIAILPSLIMPTPVFADETNKLTTEQADTEGCKYSALQKQYMDDSTCWYCMVVGKMTGAYLYAASLIMPTVKTLALLVVKIGFLIWLALHILKQVSSLSPTSVGKMLQEILVMGFKVLLATLIINNGISFLNAYLLTPIIDTGIDVGNAIFDEIARDFDISNQGGK